MAEQYAVIDVETTGTFPGKDKIIEVAIVCVENGQLTHTWSSLVYPQKPVPRHITRLTGIDDEMLANAPVIGDLGDEIIRLLGKRIIVGHNVSFDRAFLEAELGVILTNEFFDTVSLARMALPTQPSYRLSSLTQQLAIVHEQSHRAKADAMATAQLFLQLIAKAMQWQWPLYYYLQRLLGEGYNSYARLFNSLLNLKTRDHAFEQNSTSSLVVNCEEDSIFSLKLKGQREIPNKPLMDIWALKEMLKKGGALDNAVANFEHRPQQINMMEAIADSIQQGKHLLVEAGTGTGKSIAYLLPAVEWSLRSGQKVVISTNTINLQEQLWRKDIPLLQKVIGEPFTAALVKGRSNYLCIRRWQRWLNDQRSVTEKTIFAVQLWNWILETRTGDRSELNISTPNKEYWYQICGDNETCTGSRCQYYQNKCFIMRAKRSAEEADILIANHSLVLADIKLDNKVLPAYQILVVDEAHHLEEEATEQLGYTFAFSTIMRFLSNLLSGQQQETPGLINNLKLRQSTLGQYLDEEERQALRSLLDDSVEKTLVLREGCLVFFNHAGQVLQGHQDKESGRLSLRLDGWNRQQDFWQPMGSDVSNIQVRMAKLIEILKRVLGIFENSHYGSTKFVDEIRELQGFITFFKDELAKFNIVTCPNDETCVYWVDGLFQEGKGYNLEFKAVPIMVSQILYEKLFSEKPAVIMTSATLSVNNSFDYIINQLGLNLLAVERLNSLQVDSPFDYERQALLCAVRDLPEPMDGDTQFLRSAAKVVRDLACVSGGRTLVLFTSHKMLKQVYQLLKEPLESEGIILLGHNVDGGRSKILEEFKGNNKAVLMGTSSFWEGLDLPGEYLTCLVIVKMPFAVPTIPQVEARSEYLTKLGKDSFRHFALPQAIIKFKQGFGRLIRTQKDRGVVVVLDNRLVTRSYGNHFLRSLPVKNLFKGEADLVIDKVNTWLREPEFEAKPKWKNINNIDALKALLKDIPEDLT